MGNEWKPIQPMKSAHDFLSCAILNNRLVVLGVKEGTTETFDFEQNSWTVGTGFSTRPFSGYSFVNRGHLYALYGKSDVLRLEEDGNSWDKVANVEWRRDSSRHFNQPVWVTKEMIRC